VVALVIEDGGDEDEAIAALLHDAVEDQGGIRTLNEIRSRFGERVAMIVEGCTDSFSFPKPPWKVRKDEFLARLSVASPEILRVSLADKVHNAATTLRDIQQEGTQVWGRFNGGKDSTLWYYKSLLKIFEERSDSILVSELRRLISELSLSKS
jgi:(p)ppGpp synthase/HD superfamily hydrolase